MKFLKKSFALITALTLVLGTFAVTAVSAAEPWDGLLKTDLLTAPVSLSENTADDHYIMSGETEGFLSSVYLKLGYTVTGDVTDETEVFILKPYTTGYGGWDDNYVTIGNSVKNSDGSYTAYVSVESVKNSLSAEGTLMGINLYFAEPSGYTDVTLSEYAYLSQGVSESDYTVTSESVTVSNAGNSAALLVALYDADGVLLNAKTYSGSGTITAAYAADMADDVKSAATLRAYTWTDTESIAPLGVYIEKSMSDIISKAKLLLGNSIAYCDAMDESKYQPESWTTFKAAVETARTAYNTKTSDTDLTSARSALEKAKASLLFVDSTDPGDPLPFNEQTKDEVVYDMGVGWNLGNTMEGHGGLHPSETAWQQFTTTKEMIRALHDAGFNTIRIPVTWGDMIDDDNNYAINDAWISRVQDIVDYCTEQDMYAIINIHHDGAEQTGWLRVAADDIDSVYEKFEGVWRSIAERFRDYDEHLIFESANELTCMEGDDKNSSEAQAYDTPIIMNLNQIFVNTVRATGSNNKYRWLCAVSHYANRGTSNGFALPTDSYNSNAKIMFAQHIYKATNQETWDWTAAKQLVDVVKQSRNKFKNAPIILGEYGTRNKKYSGNPSGYNDLGRAYYFECATRAGQVGATVPVVWDDSRAAGNDVFETGVYTVWDRESNTPVFKSITDAMMRGMFITPTTKNKSYDMSDIEQNPTVTEITKITPSSDSVTLELGESISVTAETEPSDTNDVVLWSSDDDNIATVYRGKITGSRPGVTYVTAASQSGSTETEIKVTVVPKSTDDPAKTITVSKDAYSISAGSYEFIEASADNGEQLYYSSSDESVATVSALGKVVAKSAGRAYVTIAAESGITKTVPVDVTENNGSINVAANVYYNGPDYYGTERTEPVEIIKDGQYTLTFDTETMLSDTAKKGGVKYLENMGSLYLKDYDVDVNGMTKTPVDSCEIRYDEIKVNDTPLTITNTGFKSALKGEVLDTGDPLNAWEGSAVSEITTDKKNYRVNFSSIDNPTKIEITFTISNLVFSKSEAAAPITSMSVLGDTDIKAASGAEGTLEVSILPADTTSKIVFVSSDKSVVLTDESAAAAQNGTASCTYAAVGTGTATVTAIAESGVTAVFNITVE